MENDVLDFLEDLGYSGPILKDEHFQKAIGEGAKSLEYTQVIEWLSKELQVLCELESCVNAITDVEDSSSFLLELSSFLKEMNCPHHCLMEGPVSQRLVSEKSRLLLLDYLCSELEAARMVSVNKPDKSKMMKVEMQESSTAKELKEMLITLGFGKPPPEITPIQLFTKVEGKIKEILRKLPPTIIGKPLFIGSLTEKQWFALGNLQQQIHEDYTGRRAMLLKRLDVTVQSFKWADRLKSKADQINQVFTTLRKNLVIEPSVNISDLLAAREDVALFEKTSSASVRKNTKSSVNRVIIGTVPDRGGRPEEQQPPPPEMPSWQKKNDPPRGGFGGGFGGSGGRGSYNSDRGSGRVQGGWQGGSGGNDNRRDSDRNSDRSQRSRPDSGGADSHSNASAGYGLSTGYQGGGYQQSNVGYQGAGGGGGYPATYITQGGGFSGFGGYTTGYPPNAGYQQPGFGGYSQGVGFGGYSATGGNYQQNAPYSQSGGSYQDGSRGGGSGGRGSRGGRGRGRGGRGGRGGGHDNYHGGGGGQYGQHQGYY